MTPFDPEALATQSTRLRRLAIAIVGDSEADDVVQDAWLAALDSRGREPDRWAAWLTRVTRNLAWKRRIADGRRRDREDRVAREEGLRSPDELVADIEEKHVVERALLALEEPYRSVLLWRHYDDLSIQEISLRSGTPESTTRTHLQRGLERLRERLKSEQGPDWRAALYPLLGRDSAPPVAAGLLAAVGGFLMVTLDKTFFLALLAATAWFLAQTWDGTAVEGVAVDPTQEAPIELVADADVDEPMASSPAARVNATPPEAPPEAVVPVVSQVAAARIVGPISGLPVPGARIWVDHRSEKHEFAADEDGGFELPFTIEAGERPLRAQVLIENPNDRDVDCRVTIDEESGAVDFRIQNAFVFEVGLPSPLDEADLEGLAATVSFVESTGLTLVQIGEYRPVHSAEGHSVFIIPKEYREIGRPDITGLRLRLSTGTGGHYFLAELPGNANLAGGPYMAVAADQVTQPLIVVEAESGEPVEGALVSLRELGQPRHKPVVLGTGFSDADGRLSLAGIPPGPVRVIMNKRGYDLTQTEITVLGEDQPIELRLPAIPGTSDLEVTLSGLGSEVPNSACVTVYSQPSGFIAVSEIMVIRENKGSGWSATHTLTDLSPGACTVVIDTDVAGLGTSDPIEIELPRKSLVIELAPAPPSFPLILVLPAPLAYADFRIGEDGHFTRTSIGAQAGAPVAHVLEGGHERNWMVHAAGYAPAYGHEDAWHEARWNRKRAFEIRPELERGWGCIIEVADAQGPVDAARILDGETGALLATTDDRGFARITADQPIETVVVTAGAERRQELTLPASAYAKCRF